MSTKKEIVGVDEKTIRIFKIYCEDTHLSDDTPAFALYLAGYKAATSLQEAKIKALVEALELLDAAYCENDMSTREARHRGRVALIKAREAIAAAKE